MPRIVSVRTAVPPFRVEQPIAREYARQHFTGRLPGAERLLSVFDNAGIATRHFCVPPEWFVEEHSLEEKNRQYIESATRLSAEVCRAILSDRELIPSDIDYIIFINTTGLATPSIDARLINLLKFRENIRRTPIWGLGCAGGAAGLSHAYHYLLGHADHRVLLVAAELCGLTFVHDDYSRSNLIATALFADGAAGVLIEGDQLGNEGLEIVSTQSHFYPDSLDVMGWNIVSKGMQVVFDRRIPDIVAENAAVDLSVFLKQNGLTLQDIDQFLFHPGGIKVLEAYEKALSAGNGKFDYARETLREFGNMSSVTILFVLEKYFSKNGGTGVGHGLLSALGPGFSSESLLVRL